MPFHHSRLIAFAVVAGALAMPGAASGQTSAPATPPAAEEKAPSTAPAQPEAQPEAMTPTDAQLKSFAAATIDIIRLREAAQKQMQEAVEKAGLTIEEYNGIAQAAQNDPEVDQTLQQLIQDRLGG